VRNRLAYREPDAGIGVTLIDAMRRAASRMIRTGIKALSSPLRNIAVCAK